MIDKGIIMKKILLCLALSSPIINSAETDQFYARDAVIRDSANELNGYFQEKIELAIDKSNRAKQSLDCREVALNVFTQVLGEFDIGEYVQDKTFSKVSYFTQTDLSIERFPADNFAEKNYRADSIYKKRTYPSNLVGIARTINVDGIYMGTDKIGHFSIIGKTYYKNFLAALKNGKTPEQATEIAINKGIKQEIAFLGYAIGGVMAYGDLEANFQGLMFARNMCEGSAPHIIFKNNQWKQNPENLFNIKDYVNPKFDESFNVSLWSPSAWGKMKNEIITGYCLNRVNSNYKKRVESYLPRIKETINDKIINQFLVQNKKFDRKNQLLSPNFQCPK